MEYSWSSDKEKAVMFFSASSPRHAKIILDRKIPDLLVSYFYIRKSLKTFTKLFQEAGDMCFMTDSGAHSFQSDAKFYVNDLSFWEDYVQEYCAYLMEHRDFIYCAANLDIDLLVGREKVDEWNKKYFEPLEEYMNIIYVSHENDRDDFTGLKRFKEYCSKYDYVGINQAVKANYRLYYEIAKTTNTKIHGFAWTSIPMLKICPFFSVDSTTWLGGARYGTTYCYDGKNFRVIDYKKKHVRKRYKYLCREKGISFEDVMEGKELAINQLNLENWKGARNEFIRIANQKLRNLPVKAYDKRPPQTLS